MRLDENEVRLQALDRAPPPPAADAGRWEAGRVTCSECETGTGKLCEIKWDYHIFGMRAYGRFGTRPASNEATMINHVVVTNVARTR